MRFSYQSCYYSILLNEANSVQSSLKIHRETIRTRRPTLGQERKKNNETTKGMPLIGSRSSVCVLNRDGADVQGRPHNSHRNINHKLINAYVKRIIKIFCILIKKF